MSDRTSEHVRRAALVVLVAFIAASPIIALLYSYGIQVIR